MGSDFLFARPSFAAGIARTLDLFGVFDEYNVSRGESEADARALYWDFRLVGEDLFAAAGVFGATVGVPEPPAEPVQHSFVFAQEHDGDDRIAR